MRTFFVAMQNIYDHLVLYVGLLWLGLICLAWTPIALMLYPLLPVHRGRAIGRYVTMLSFRLFLASLALSRRFSFDLQVLDELRNEPPMIIAPNHPCLLDAVMIISRLPNVACVMKAELMRNIFLGAGARLARYISNEPVRRMIQMAIQDFASGSHLLLFPEGTRTVQSPTNPFKGSAGLISRHAQVPVQTILIETNSAYLSKGWPLLRKPPMPVHYRMRLGKRFDPPENTQHFMAELENYFAHELMQSSTHISANSPPVQATHLS